MNQGPEMIGGMDTCMVMKTMHPSKNNKNTPFKCALEEAYSTSLNFVQFYKTKIDLQLPQVSTINLINFKIDFQNTEFHEVNPQLERPPIYVVVSSFII